MDRYEGAVALSDGNNDLGEDGGEWIESNHFKSC